MAKTNQEFLAGLAEKLGTKMKTIQQSSNDLDKTMTAVCEAETILVILKDFLELEKTRKSESQSDDSSEDYEDDDEPKVTRKATY